MDLPLAFWVPGTARVRVLTGLGGASEKRGRGAKERKLVEAAAAAIDGI